MSHVVVMEFEVTDKECLLKAAAVLGLEYREGQRTFRTWESEHNMGTSSCDDAIRLPNNRNAYEIGVVHTPAGSFELKTDFYMGGHGMEQVVGEEGWKLKQEYTSQFTQKQYEADGFSVSRQTTEDGRILLEAYR